MWPNRLHWMFLHVEKKTLVLQRGWSKHARRAKSKFRRNMCFVIERPSCSDHTCYQFDLGCTHTQRVYTRRHTIMIRHIMWQMIHTDHITFLVCRVFDVLLCAFLMQVYISIPFGRGTSGADVAEYQQQGCVWRRLRQNWLQWSKQLLRIVETDLIRELANE